MYQPNNGRGVPISDESTPLPHKGSDSIFSYENLPENYWKKYVYAARYFHQHLSTYCNTVVSH